MISSSGHFHNIWTRFMSGKNASKVPHFAALTGGYALAGPTNPRAYTRKELLGLTGITSRQLTYYIEKGAVDAPEGRTRAAKYTHNHVQQIRRTVDLKTRSNITVSEIAETFARRARSPGRKASSQENCQGYPKVQHVYQVTDGISIVSSGNLLASEQAILERLKKAATSSMKERARMVAETLARLK
jgi:DNA-binding transcriptional MerR regulator